MTMCTNCGRTFEAYNDGPNGEVKWCGPCCGAYVFDLLRRKIISLSDLKRFERIQKNFTVLRCNADSRYLSTQNINKIKTYGSS